VLAKWNDDELVDDQLLAFLTRLAGGRPPYLTPEQRAELVLLRREYGLGWHEVEHVLPAWEVDMLLEPYNERAQAVQVELAALEETTGAQAPPGSHDDPFATVPDFLKEMRVGS
jgi:hypothetical protein